MKTLTFAIVLAMELSYAVSIISNYMGESWKWSAVLPVAAVCGISAFFVWLYCRLRKVSDVKAIMKSGTALVCGIEVGAILVYFIVTRWRWLV